MLLHPGKLLSSYQGKESQNQFSCRNFTLFWAQENLLQLKTFYIFSVVNLFHLKFFDNVFNKFSWRNFLFSRGFRAENRYFKFYCLSVPPPQLTRKFHKWWEFTDFLGRTNMSYIERFSKETSSALNFICKKELRLLCMTNFPHVAAPRKYCR